MPAKRKKEQIRCAFFTWLLGERDGVYFADGRSNRPPLGRHSLSTRDRGEALEALKQLDRVKAVEAGLADKSILGAVDDVLLPLADGRKLYEAHVNRPRVVGGGKKVTAKRYRAVFDKFDAFAADASITFWNQLNRRVLESYAAFLDDEGYAYATQYLELTFLKQVVKWLIEEHHLPAGSPIHLPLAKPQGTTTYCWRREEVKAMTEFCAARKDLAWIGEIITALACTGLRISELAGLRWTDIDLEKPVILLTDESTHGRRDNDARRETKSGRSRSFPIRQELLAILQKKVRATDGFVFHGVLGGRLKPDTLRNALIRDVLTPLSERFPKTGDADEFIDGRLHSFRHYFCSACANTGVPEQVVKDWLGHADSKMIRHYYHLHDDESQRQMRRVNFFGSAGDNVAAGEIESPAEAVATQMNNREDLERKDGDRREAI